MPDIDDRANQILAIGRVLSRIPTGQKDRYIGTPAPVIGMWATELHDELGVRVHEDLARKELVRVQSPLGNNGPVRAVTKDTPARVDDDTDVQRMQHARELMFDFLRTHNPGLADRIERAQDDPELQAIVLNDIVKQHPEVWAKGQELVDQAMAEAANK
ncbi:MAG: hypothetical protein AB1925_12470 [Actinomycetota bacterium]